MNILPLLQPGDVVLISFPRINADKQYYLRIVAILPYCESVKGINLSSGKEERVKTQWIQSVTKRAIHQHLPTNLNVDRRQSGWITSTQHVYIGSVTSIIETCLSKLPFLLNRPFDAERAREKFEEDSKPGFVSYLPHENPHFELVFDDFGNQMVILKKDKIERWVRHHAYSFMMSVANLRAIKAHNTRVLNEYYK